MFWENLTQAEQDQLHALQIKAAPYLTWCSDKPKTRGICPEIPSDDDLMKIELLSMKGWKMES